jgi:hypothetical protein
VLEIGSGRPGPSLSCFVPNGLGPGKPKKLLGRAVLAQSVKTVAQPGPNHVMPLLGRAGVTPGSGGKTECIAYVCQDPFSTHMLMSQV